MNKSDAKKRIEKLKEVISYHRFLYHVEDTEEITEDALDSLKHELYELEQEYPGLITADSPTQRVGGEPKEAFTKYTHTERMLSMEDVFSFEELRDWKGRAERFVDHEVDGFYCMSKVDGLAMSLVYQGGVLEVAATRGNGTVGENVTENVKTIESVPLRLKALGAEEMKKLKDEFTLSDQAERALTEGQLDLNVRGEVYMRKQDFEALNVRRKKAGEEEFANPRNVSAGSIRQLDPKITASRPLRFLAWHLGGIDVPSQSAAMAILTAIGFRVADGRPATDLDDVQTFHRNQEKRREKIPYWIDGTVVRVDDMRAYKNLGVVGKAPRGLVAWKFPPEEVTTKVVFVEWSVGRTGKLTPIATVTPAFVAGTTVTHATLHNVDEIERLGVQIGDTVILTKAGDIIPKIIKVLEDLRDGSETAIKIPERCPVCASEIIEKEGAVDLRCGNKSCFSMERERILHAARAFDVLGLGSKTVEKLIQAGLLVTPLDLFRMRADEIAPIEGLGELSAEKLLKEIEGKKLIDLEKFIVALSIPNVGGGTAHELARTFGSVEALAKAPKEDLVAIQDIGDVVADDIVTFFASDSARLWLAGYKELGIVVVPPKKTSSKFEGKTFVLTGSLQGMTREEAKARIKEHGGSVSNSVSKKTDYVVVGDSPGSKAKKAEALGVTILPEEAFSAMV